MPKNGNFIATIAAMSCLTPVVFPVTFEGLADEAHRASLQMDTTDLKGDESCRSDSLMPCPACPTLAMPPQYRCNTPAVGLPCTIDMGGENYNEQRQRWKWKCPDETAYISCGDWVAISCCSEYDPGPACAGSSGLPVCQGVPPR